jgi:hypothetical protein
MKVGSVSKKAAIPVLATLPVVCRTNQGMAINRSVSPINEMVLAANSA